MIKRIGSGVVGTRTAEDWYASLTTSEKGTFSNVRSQIYARIIDELNGKPPPVPDEVVHYTTIGGFCGILNSNQMFFSNASTMKDASELRHAQKVAKIAIEEAYSKSPRLRERKFLAYTLQRLEHVGQQEATRSYVACFTAKTDAVSHWSQYSRAGSISSGMAIHFNTKKLKKILSGQGVNIFRCIYAQKEHMEYLTMLLTYGLSEFYRLGKLSDMGPRFFEIGQESLLYALASFLALIKNSSYSADAEWRALYYHTLGSDPKHIEVFATEELLKRRTNIAFGASGLRECITGITVGPCNDRQYSLINRQGAEALLKRKGIDVAVKESMSDYRPGI